MTCGNETLVSFRKDLEFYSNTLRALGSDSENETDKKEAFEELEAPIRILRRR